MEDLDWLSPWLDKLGVDGMSGDESDHSSSRFIGNRQFKAQSVWRRSKNVDFLGILELLASSSCQPNMIWEEYPSLEIGLVFELPEGFIQIKVASQGLNCP